MTVFHSPYKALVIGASGTIGAAFSEILHSDPACSALTELSRTSDPEFDFKKPEQLESVASRLLEHGPWDLVIDATGALTLEGQGPEKTLNALKAETLIRAMEVNAVGPILLMKALKAGLSKGPCWYAKLSARVGSIEDNHLGGWYGYRAAKAALNQYLKTAAIELHRTHPQLCVVAMQPGTVRSPLSAPFIRDESHLTPAQESAQGLLDTLWTLAPGQDAHFIDYRGGRIPW